ncbi:unnamed protein product [Adineta steineri]|uniref:Uncharacterized protein n=1 Tax=Adineta steineri TaxID=433720 RepID=A0A815F7G4_9BILA|nr:unnamed protein product [Adineta steineri]CAF3838447.1 unnamed protein product [Adineta steineri]
MQNQINSSLRCPCNQLTASYGQLVRLQPFFHQVCSSDLITLAWINDLVYVSLIYTNGAPIYAFTRTRVLFQILQDLCQWSNQTIVQSLETFGQLELVTGYLLTVDLFENQMNSAIEQFKAKTTKDFLRLILLMRNITFINQFCSFQSHNVLVITTPAHAATFTTVNTINNAYNASDTCSCANDTTCKAQFGLYNDSYSPLTYLVPGLYKACFPIESLFQSTLECFYDNQDCFTIIKNYFKLADLHKYRSLNSSLDASRFPINSTVGSIATELFIEYWSQPLSYSAYFDLCQPESCSYTLVQSDNLLKTVTTIIGLIGGLSISLRILVPIVVTACIALIRRRRRHRLLSIELSK